MAIGQIQPDTDHIKSRLSDSEKQILDEINETSNHRTNTEPIAQTSDSENVDDINGDDTNVIHTDLITDLREDIKKNNKNMISFYYEEHSKLDLFETPFQNNQTALMLAVKHESHAVIQEILQNGISSQNVCTVLTAYTPQQHLD